MDEAQKKEGMLALEVVSTSTLGEHSWRNRHTSLQVKCNKQSVIPGRRQVATCGAT